jgi:hypothetical protein
MIEFHYSGTSRSLRSRTWVNLLLVVGLFIGLGLAPAYAQTQIRWQCNMGSGLWDFPQSWDLNRVPRPGDNVTINCPGAGVVVTLRTDAAINALQNNETLQWLAGNLNVANGFTNSGTLVLPSLWPPGFRGMLVNTGRIVENMPYGWDFRSATLNNRGVYELQEGGIIGSGTLLNAGTIRKSSPATAWVENLLLNNSGGRVEVLGGTLNVIQGASMGNITYSVAAGSRLVYGDHTFAGTHMGAVDGSMQLAWGTLGVGSGGATFNITGSGFQWLGGDINGASSGLTNAGSLMIVPSACNAPINLRGLLVNMGTLVENTSCALNFASATLQNRGLYDLQAGNITGAGLLNNTSTVRKSGEPDSVANISAPLNNAGTVEAVSGTLQISGPITQLSGTTLTGGTWNVFDPATLNITSPILTNSTTILLDGPSANFPTLRGLVTNNGTLNLADAASLTTTGSVTNAGSLGISSSSIFSVGGANTDYTQTGGATLLDNGALTAVRNVLIQGGRLAGIGSVSAQMVSNAGEVGPGNSVGLINIRGDYVQTSAGKLRIQIGGTGDMQFDRLVVSGNATLDGILSIELLDSYAPALGDRFRIINYGSRTGTFPRVDGLRPFEGWIFQLQYNDNDLTLVLAEDTPGNY